MVKKFMRVKHAEDCCALQEAVRFVPFFDTCDAYSISFSRDVTNSEIQKQRVMNVFFYLHKA